MKLFKIVGILCLFMVLFLSFSGVKVYAASVEAVYGSTPTINGIMAPGEWIDASTVTFSGPSGTCTVYVKQNVTHLNIAIHVPDNTVDQFDWFEVCLDTNHDDGSRPQTDDYGLLMTRGFVSHLRQESVGDGLNWVSQTISGWNSSAAWTNSDYTIELSIGYTKLGITAGIAKTLGIEFQVWDDSGSTKYRWTAGSDNSNPSTWGEVTSHWSYPIHQGDLVLTGNNVTVIEGRFDINGSIIVEENATLILKNAIINFTQITNYEYKMDFRNPANGNPRLQALNSTLTSKFIFPVVFHDNSSAIIREVTTLKCYLEAFDYSTVDVIDSTVVDLWAYEYSVLTVANSTITATLRGSDYSTVSASNCTTKYFDTWGRPTVNISNSNITHDLLPTLKSVNCSVTGLNPGLFQSWNSLQDCSVVEAAEGFAPNITLLDTQILSWSLSFLGSSNATVRNSKLRYLYASGSSTVNVCNSTDSYRGIEQSARVYVYWYLGVHVVDSINQDVPSANVTATYPNATVVESKLADANGWARFTLLEKMMNATGDYPVGNYTVEATYDIYSDQTTVNITENQQTTLTLADFIIPEFPSFLILPLFMIATLLAVIVYKRKESM